MSIDFYTDLPAFHHLTDITNPSNFAPVPLDWCVVITDIKDSTKAIEAGRYKDINLLTASTIVSILNITQAIEVPFVFGGDGATILIPSEILCVVKASLVSTKKLSETVFNFDLRVGIIPVETIIKEFPILVGKLAISPFYTQAILRGGGISYAEKLIKQKETAPLYQLSNENVSIPADYTGLECRWQDIKSPKDETLSIIIQAMTDQPDRVYREAIDHITQICGGEECLRPVSTDRLHLSFNSRQLEREAKVFKGNSWQKFIYLCFIWLVNLLGFLLMKFKVRNQDLDWGKYPNLVVTTTDYQKFDDSLKMVIACTIQERIKIEEYLQLQYQQKKLYFGVHISDRALMTCLVFERNGRQVHFIDGADGGYALAAKQLKSQIKSSR